ncbi:TetR/AcrR family transcriptional regulator [bacterium]|nr:TetR/AcrR family transcriptional regulator [bacterium]
MKENSVTPRKQPSQDRSKEKVKRILEATIRLLEKSGVESITAIKVAKEAGVAVASFYQYFPNKSAVIYTLYQQFLGTVLERMDKLEKEKYLKITWPEFFLELSNHLLEIPCFSEKADEQLSRAMEFFPDLQPLETKHANNVALRLAQYLKGYGCRWQETELLDLGLYLYRASNSLFSVSIGEKNDQQERFLSWSREVLMALVAKCFDD